jgi:hypothetical protein
LQHADFVRGGEPGLSIKGWEENGAVDAVHVVEVNIHL